MKKLLLLLTALLWIAKVNSQNANDLIIYGTIVTNANEPVVNHLVNFLASNGDSLGVAYTGPSGYYDYTLVNGSVIGPNQIFLVNTIDCNGQIHQASVSNQQGTVNSAQINFVFNCSTLNPDVAFEYEFQNQNGNTHVLLSPSGDVNAADWTWFFVINPIQDTVFMNQSSAQLSDGIYDICMHATQLSTGYSDIVCQTVVVSNNPNTCNYTLNVIEPTDSNQVWQFSVMDNAGVVIISPLIQWTVQGNNLLLTEETSGVFNYSFIDPGNYIVCAGANYAGCIIELCSNIVAEPNYCAGLSAQFNYSISPSGMLTAWVSTPQNPAIYTWLLNNDFAGTGPQISFGTIENGNIPLVCLSADNGFCNLVQCQEIISEALGQISGIVSGAGSSISGAQVILFSNGNNSWQVASTISNDSGSFAFANLFPGNYIIYVIPAAGPNTPGSLFAPTYSGNVLSWPDAQWINVSAGTITNTAIDLILLEETSGSGLVTGNVQQGPMRVRDDASPFSNMVIVLSNAMGAAKKWTQVNEDGTFALSNLAFGVYHIWAEWPGFESPKIEFEISAAFPSIEITVYLNDMGALSIDINQQANDQWGLCYPNPAMDRVQLPYTGQGQVKGNLDVIDVKGNVVFSMNLNDFIKDSSFSVINWAQGLYVIKLTTEFGTIQRRLIVAR